MQLYYVVVQEQTESVTLQGICLRVIRKWRHDRKIQTVICGSNCCKIIPTKIKYRGLGLSFLLL